MKRLCHICYTKIEPKKVRTINKTYADIVTEWYSICPSCINHYDELLETFHRISNQNDDIEEPNHTIMFNLIDAIKKYRYGCRFIPKFRDQI